MKKILLMVALLGLTEQALCKDPIQSEDARLPKNRKSEEEKKKNKKDKKDKKSKKACKKKCKKPVAAGKSPMRERGGDKDKGKKPQKPTTKKASVQSIRINNYREKEKKEIK